MRATARSRRHLSSQQDTKGGFSSYSLSLSSSLSLSLSIHDELPECCRRGCIISSLHRPLSFSDRFCCWDDRVEKDASPIYTVQSPRGRNDRKPLLLLYNTLQECCLSLSPISGAHSRTPFYLWSRAITSSHRSEGEA